MLTLYYQLQHMNMADLGGNRENTMNFKAPGIMAFRDYNSQHKTDVLLWLIHIGIQIQPKPGLR